MERLVKVIASDVEVAVLAYREQEDWDPVVDGMCRPPASLARVRRSRTRPGDIRPRHPGS
jgi:hypothetical protein